MKKYLNELLAGCAAFLCILVLLLMLAPGVNITLLGKASYSVYEVMNFGDTFRAGILIALLFVIFSLLGSACLVATKFLKIKFDFAWIVACVLALFMLVAGILFFCCKPIAGLGGNEYAHLGAGGVLCGIFSILAAFPLGYLGYVTKK